MPLVTYTCSLVLVFLLSFHRVKKATLLFRPPAQEVVASRKLRPRLLLLVHSLTRLSFRNTAILCILFLVSPLTVGRSLLISLPTLLLVLLPTTRFRLTLVLSLLLLARLLVSPVLLVFILVLQCLSLSATLPCPSLLARLLFPCPSATLPFPCPSVVLQFLSITMLAQLLVSPVLFLSLSAMLRSLSLSARLRFPCPSARLPFPCTPLPRFPSIQLQRSPSTPLPGSPSIQPQRSPLTRPLLFSLPLVVLSMLTSTPSMAKPLLMSPCPSTFVAMERLRFAPTRILATLSTVTLVFSGVMILPSKSKAMSTSASIVVLARMLLLLLPLALRSSTSNKTMVTLLSRHKVLPLPIPILAIVSTFTITSGGQSLDPSLFAAHNCCQYHALLSPPPLPSLPSYSYLSSPLP